MIDPELKYCPQCNDEYRAEIEVCAACGVALLSGADMLAAVTRADARKNSRAGEIGPGEDIVAIHKGQLNEIRAMEKELQAENIGYLITGEGSSCKKGCCPTTFYLQVRRQDAPDAFAVVQAHIERTTALNHHDLSTCDAVFNPEARQATCPACGFEFQTNTTVCPDCGLCFG
ncbi:MAG: hypothetical protein M0P70_17090 [Desulfobulbaceae bacterium]|nr:hypothetical protein [Desulfobulbaceae bacterium]